MKLKLLLVVFLAMNALFWGLFPHSAHCALVKATTNIPCPSHDIHLVMGGVCYALALFVAQYSHIMGHHAH